MQNNPYDIAVFLVATIFLIMLMGVFILTILFMHRKKQITFQEKIKEVEANYEKNLLQTQLEIQEQTFQNISREIHDNISLSLTLAKLHLHTLDWQDDQKTHDKIDLSIGLLTKSITELRGISQGLNADIIFQQGLLKAIEEEIGRIRQTGLFKIDYKITGTPVYLDHKTELIIFRIVQEGFNNIIKHAEADEIKLILNYNISHLEIEISDDGLGFNTDLANKNCSAGLKNMDTRVKLLKGIMQVTSSPGKGTSHLFTIPFE